MRILLADNQAKVRFALRALLGQMPDVTIASEADNAEHLLEQVGVVRPDLVLLDWGLYGRAAEDLVVEIRRLASDVIIIALSGRPECRRAALSQGADAFVSKAEPPEELLTAIQKCWSKVSAP
jgi:DNA-binding NarL/FixJ family response regulator